MTWTPEKEAQLIELCYTQKHIKDIARAMGLRPAQVSNKINHLRKQGVSV
jgi:transposase-like protein